MKAVSLIFVFVFILTLCSCSFFDIDRHNRTDADATQNEINNTENDVNTDESAETDTDVLPYDPLYYQMKEDGTYEVYKLIQSCSKVVIASYYENIPVTSIRDGAFYECRDLVEVTIPNTIETIGSNAFSGCSSLQKIDIPKSVTYIDPTAFDFCGGVEEITVDAENEIYHSDGNCLIETQAHALVKGCRNSVLPSDGSVNVIGENAFLGCYSLLTVTIPSVIEAIDEHAFDWCYKLVEVIDYSGQMPNDIGSVVSPLIHQGASTIDTSGDFAFYVDEQGTSYLLAYTGLDTTIQLPENYRNKSYAIFPYAFYLSSNVKGVYFTHGIDAIGDSAFLNCYELSEVVLGDGLVSIGAAAFYNCDNLTVLSIPSGVEYIGDEAFAGCDGLVEVSLADTVRELGSGVFSSCKKLKNIVLSSSLTEIADTTFFECVGLERIAIPEGVLYIGANAFQWCYSLSDVDLPSTLIHIGFGAFESCKALNEINMPDRLEVIDFYAFSNCESLKTLYIPQCVDTINTYAFDGCSDLEYIGVSNQNDRFYSIDNCLIDTATKTLVLGCKNSIIPTGSAVLEIGYHAFYKCYDLTKINIPEGVKRVSHGAFERCDNLMKVYLPSSLELFSSDIFTYSGLKEIYYGGTAEEWKKLLERSNVEVVGYTVYYEADYLN